MSSINSQTWDYVDNNSSSSQRRTEKEGEERIAQGNSNFQGIVGLQRIEKDVVLAANPDARQAIGQAAVQEETTSKLPLPTPSTAWNAFQDSEDGTEPGLIAIMGSVLSLQARTNSNYWSTVWKQASESMMQEVKFAPVIGDAVKAAYKAQAATTLSQSNQAKNEGIISMCSFGGAVFMGGFQDFTDPENALNKDKNAIENAKETEEVKPPTTTTPRNPAAATGEVDDETNKTINNEKETFSARVKRYWNYTKDKGGQGQKRFTSLLGRCIQTATAMSMLSDGVTKYFVTSKYQAKQAMYQAQEGGAQALSKEAEQYAQFYGQDFSRNEDLRQGSGQNLDYAMNILKSAADTITQTVTSMFRS